MVLARDAASSLAIKSSAFLGTAATQTAVSNAFSPPAGSVICVIAMATQSFNNAWNAPTITSSVALTWNLASAAANVTFSGTTSQVALFWAYCPTAQTGMTVTPTFSVAGSGQTVTYTSVTVDVWTGANTLGPIGALLSGYSTASPASAVLTPQAVGSALLQAAAQTNAASTASTASTGFLKNSTATATAFSQVWIGTSATVPTLTTTTTAQTIATANAKASPRFQWLAYEVLADAGAVVALQVRRIGRRR